MKKGELSGGVVFSRYSVGACIGYGSFGEVYLVYDPEKQQILAMKTEDEKSKHPQLANEARIMKLLNGEKGFVRCHHFGYDSKSNVLIMDVLGPSLEDLFNSCNRKFSLKTILMLMDQILLRIQKLHSKNYVYRDIKPENLLIGLEENSHILHMVDFGLSKKYRDSKTHHHVAYKENKSVVGTVRYSSINTQMGVEYSRRDDLEAIGYMIQYLWSGKLPWQNLKVNNSTEKFQKILEKKLMTPVEKQFQGLPSEFSTYMNYCKALKFSQKPDYSFLRKIFAELFDRLGYKRDHKYDWCIFHDKILFENGMMSLTLYSQHKNVDNLYSGSDKLTKVEEINLKDIEVKVEKDEIREKEEINEEKLGKVNEVEEVEDVEDQDEGNIDSCMLDDSDFQLISKTKGSFMDSAY